MEVRAAVMVTNRRTPEKSNAQTDTDGYSKRHDRFGQLIRVSRSVSLVLVLGVARAALAQEPGQKTFSSAAEGGRRSRRRSNRVTTKRRCWRFSVHPDAI